MRFTAGVHVPNDVLIYDFSTENQSIELIDNINVRGSATTLNGIITSNGQWQQNSYFYTIRDRRLVQIGEMDNSYRSALMTYFFPKRNKMVQVARSGIWVYDFEYEEYVSEGDEVAPIVQVGLLGNFPNPFNPSTTIKFSLSSGEGRGEGHVNITIYNIRGQRVRTLLNGSNELGAGRHSVVWNGTDDNGRTVSSGVYFYNMRAGEYSSTRRMILMK